ncbi:hypothetical protein PV341_44620 [Streptomyces sp. PA03-1a]|nr:hypothetical protein [Streptomyces sp. PA03-1a]MDX2708464.1 hypothetical protein [Streptomyces sp. PA03-6a]MDX2811989.1 hypothetical protein [Streptomyces sp. PA03-5A]
MTGPRCREIVEEQGGIPMGKQSPNVRSGRMVRWVLTAGLSYLGAMFVVLGCLSLLPKRTQTSLSETAVGWAVLGVSVVLFTLFAGRSRGRS